MPLPDSILRLLEQLETDACAMPPTILYNEGWMLRIVLDAGMRGCLPSVMPKGARWYSEAQLRTPFGKDRGPKHEANTHADAVVGDFSDIADTKSGLQVRKDAKLFSVLEAKMYSPLSSRTKNAPGYDQAARNVACMAHALQQAQQRPDAFDAIRFFVIAPESQIHSGLFEAPMSPESIRSRVAERIQQFTGRSRDDLNQWHEHWFVPLVAKMEADQSITCLAWEDLVQQIADSDAAIGAEVGEFYAKCKQYNLTLSRATDNTDRPIRGMEYVLLSGRHQGQRVRVGSAGASNSRVYCENSREESRLVPNTNLEIVPAAEQTPQPRDPIAGREYSWVTDDDETVTVRVIKVGDLNSRVERTDSSASSFKVPNHQLLEIDA